MTKWSVVYEKAIREDGSLLFPERLTREFLDETRKTMGSYLFANQYQNEVIPDDEKTFRPEWLRRYSVLPSGPLYHFAFIDPAIGQKKHHDFTGFSVIAVPPDGVWHLRLAARRRLTPTGIVNLCFHLHQEFNLQGLGVESVAYQEALIYFISDEMKKRKTVLPLKEIKRSSESKKTRILGLVPRFEYGQILIAPDQRDFEDEYASFPRGSFDDILDSIASLDEIVYLPEVVKKELVKPHSPSDPHYETWYRQNIHKTQGQRNDSDDY